MYIILYKLNFSEGVYSVMVRGIDIIDAAQKFKKEYPEHIIIQISMYN